MQAHTLTAALAAALFALAAPAGAATIETQVGRLELPFDFTAERNYRESQISYGRRNRENWTLLATTGPLAGKRISVSSNYFATDRLDAGTMLGFVRKSAEETAAKATTRKVEPIKLDGFDFYYLERNPGDDDKDAKAGEGESDGDAAKPVVTASGEPERSYTVHGVINGAVVSVNVFVPESVAASVNLEPAMRAFALDHSSMLKLGARLDGIGKAAVQDTRMTTPIGTVAAANGTQVKLMSASVSTDGKRAVANGLGFFMSRTGFWSANYDSFHVGCDTSLATDAKRRELFLTAPEATEKRKPGPRTAARFGGIDGSGWDIAPTTGGGGTYQWIGERDGTGYTFTVSRAGNRKQTDALLEQLRKATFACTIDNATVTAMGSPVAKVAEVPVAPAPVVPETPVK